MSGYREDSLDLIREKLSFGKHSPIAVTAVVLVLVLLLVAVVVFLFKGASTPSFVVEKSSTTSSFDSGDSKANEGSTHDQKSISVHVAGCVLNPGMYSIAEGARVNDAIELAGGFNDDADQDRINLARVLSDGEQIVVPSKNDSSGNGGASADSPESATGVSVTISKVNVNTADAAELDAIPGVGPSLAKKIVSDRDANGPFKNIDELARVSGIGDKKLEGMREYVTVG